MSRQWNLEQPPALRPLYYLFAALACFFLGVAAGIALLGSDEPEPEPLPMINSAYQLIDWVPPCDITPLEPFVQFEFTPRRDDTAIIRTRYTDCHSVSPTRNVKFVVPVPEPEAGTLLLVGAVVLGYLGVRRAER